MFFEFMIGVVLWSMLFITPAEADEVINHCNVYNYPTDNDDDKEYDAKYRSDQIHNGNGVFDYLEKYKTCDSISYGTYHHEADIEFNVAYDELDEYEILLNFPSRSERKVNFYTLPPYEFDSTFYDIGGKAKQVCHKTNQRQLFETKNKDGNIEYRDVIADAEGNVVINMADLSWREVNANKGWLMGVEGFECRIVSQYSFKWSIRTVLDETKQSIYEYINLENGLTG